MSVLATQVGQFEIQADEMSPNFSELADHRRAMKNLNISTLVLAAGRGGWYTCLTIFATHMLALSPQEFGIGLSGAGAVGLLIGGPVGYLADRVGPREVLIVLTILLGVAIPCYAFARNFWTFFLVSCIAMATERTIPAIRIAVISGLTSREERSDRLMSVRVCQSFGTGIGSAFGTLALVLDDWPGYLALLWWYGMASMLSGVAARKVPHVTSLRDLNIKRRSLVLSDRPYIVLTAICSILGLCWGMLSSGLPLWVITYTQAPMWTVGVLLAMNTAAIVLFQKRFSVANGSVSSATRMTRYCSGPLAISCLLFATTYHTSGLTAVMLLISAGVVHAVGELLFVGGSWGLAIELTPSDAHGEYQGVFQAGAAGAVIFAPAIMAALVVRWGIMGWIILGALFVATGLSVGHVVRWACRDPRRDIRLTKPTKGWIMRPQTTCVFRTRLHSWKLRAKYRINYCPNRWIAAARTVHDSRLRPFSLAFSLPAGQGPSIGYAGVPRGVIQVRQTLTPQPELPTATVEDRPKGPSIRKGIFRERSIPHADLVAIVCARSQLQHLPSHRSLILPFRMHALVDVSDGAWRSRASKNEQKWFNALKRREEFCFEVATDDDSFDYFYHEMHLPTMRMRHGDHLRTEPKDSAYECLFRHGILGFVNVGGVRLAGLLGRISDNKQKITSRLVGVLNGDPTVHRQAWLKVADHLLLAWAEQNGVAVVDFHGIEAWISNGVYQRKRQLGPRLELAPNHQGHLRVWWHAQRDTPLVRDFLTVNPVVEINAGGSLRAVYFCDDDRPARRDLPYQCANVTETRTIHLDEFLSQ